MARWLFATVLILVWSPLWADVSLAGLRREHPRLIALDSDIQRIRGQIKSDPLARRLYAALVEEARRLETTPPVEYKLVGPRLLDQSRRCLQRIYTLALVFRIEQDPRYLNRALKELRAAAAFPNWNPSHFLDTAEMTHAFAIGYDWLYGALSPADRGWIRAAMVLNGLDPALEIYENRRSWTTATHNWNQVCNGGITLGALAIAEDEPARSEAILRYAVASLPLALGSYAPDGGWNEGPGYWHYATRYTSYLLAGLETALGTDFQLSAMPGFDRAGHFRVYSSGPSERTFNYADAGERTEPAEEMFWLARRFEQPVYAGQQTELLKRRGRAHALDLVWFPVASSTPQASAWQRDAVFRGTQTAFLRGSWEDPNSVWVAAKGGDNRANHSHLDLGAFVLDAGGVRWAVDLGPDNYNLPQYFGKLRWTYYRLRTESHNTVLIDGENQAPDAKAQITEFKSEPEEATVEIDLTQAYPEKLTRHSRRITLRQRRVVVVSDHIQATRPVDVIWGMVTGAEVSLADRLVTLRQEGKAMRVELVAPAKAHFALLPTQAPKPQNQNEGTRKLIVQLPDHLTAVDLEVRFEPVETRP